MLTSVSIFKVRVEQRGINSGLASLVPWSIYGNIASLFSFSIIIGSLSTIFEILFLTCTYPIESNLTLNVKLLTSSYWTVDIKFEQVTKSIPLSSFPFLFRFIF